MAHARQTLRKAIVAAVTGLATTAARVSSRQLHTRQAADLPALIVDVAAGAGESVSGAFADEFGTAHVRRLSVTITAMVSALANYEDTLDTICLEVETALWAAAGVAALVVGFGLESTVIEVSGEGDRPVAVATMVWSFSYAVNETAPEASIT